MYFKYKIYGYEVEIYEYTVLLNYPNYEKPNRIEYRNNQQWIEISNGLADILGSSEAVSQVDGI